MDNENGTDKIAEDVEQLVEDYQEENAAEQQYDDVLISWSSVDDKQAKRGSKWYLVWILIIIALIGASLAVNIFLGVWQIWTTVGLAIIVFISLIVIDKQPKQAIKYELTNEYISINGKATPLSDFQAFTITDQGNTQAISLIPVKRVSIPFDLTVSTEEAGDVVDILSAHMPLNQTGLNFTDRISKILKL